MLHCNEVTRLWASDAIRTASLRTRIAVRIHLIMCRSCQRYVQELTAIGDAVRDLSRTSPDDQERMDALVRRVLPDRSHPDK